MIGEFINRVTIIRKSAPTQTASGGLVAGAETTFEKWAKVEDRTGTVNKANGREWNYDYKITVRYEPSMNYYSTDFVEFGGMKMSVREVSFNKEGKRKFVILRCSRHE